MSTQVEISDAKNQLKRAKNALMENPTDTEQWLISAKCHRALNLNDYAMIDVVRMGKLLAKTLDPKNLFRCYLEYMESSMALNRYDLTEQVIGLIEAMVPPSISDYQAMTSVIDRFKLNRSEWYKKYESCIPNNVNSLGRLPSGYKQNFIRTFDIDVFNADLQKISSRLTLASRGGNHFGLYATKDIKKGELILQEKTRVGVTCNSDQCDNCTKPFKGSSVQCKRCGTRFCSTDCMKEALLLYHLLLCPKVNGEAYQQMMQQSRDSRTGLALYCPMLLRVYSIAIKENVSPLEVEEIKTLCPTEGIVATSVYNQSVDYFYFQLLELLNISPFQPKGRFDFKTYKHVISKFGSNSFGEIKPIDSDVGLGIPKNNALFRFASFFNHSCDPNVSYVIQGNVIMATASRKIKKNEQVFISYTKKGSKVSRGRTLFMTYGFDCKCSKCVADKSRSYLESQGGKLVEALRKPF